MKALKITGVILLAGIITSLSIDAADTLSGKGGTMLGQLIGGIENACEAGMVKVSSALTFSCVDKYEVSAGENCAINEPTNQFDTEVNLSNQKCLLMSDESGIPWRHINRQQAEVMCTRDGKRLPTASEWYKFSLGTPGSSCNTGSNKVFNGRENPECVSASGVNNTVGNVWEWVSDDIIDGLYEGRKLPNTGYVTQVDNGGMATMTSEEKLADGYFWSGEMGALGIIRGGFYGSRSDAAVYTVHAETSPNFFGTAVGFRCVK